MAVRNIDTSTWKAVTYIDLNPGPGCYVGENSDYEIRGEKIQAFNPCHAQYIWGLTVCGRTGYDGLNKCAHCGVGIRHVIVFKDGEGNYHPVGETCAEFIESKLDRDIYLENRFLASVKYSNKTGGYYVSSKLDEAAPWYWDLLPNQRPEGVRTSKYRAPGKTYEEWYLQVWGDDAREVMENFLTLRALKPVALENKRLADLEAERKRAETISDAEQRKIQRDGEKLLNLKASTKKTDGGYLAVLRSINPNKVVWHGATVHRNRDFDSRHSAALPEALRELRQRLVTHKATT